jgi:hypothetical protein
MANNEKAPNIGNWTLREESGQPIGGSEEKSGGK